MDKNMAGYCGKCRTVTAHASDDKFVKCLLCNYKRRYGTKTKSN